MNRKILFILSVLFIFAILVIPLSADDTVATDYTVARGESITFDITIEEKAIVKFGVISIEFDAEIFKLVGVSWKSNSPDNLEFDSDTGEITFSYSEDTDITGSIISVQFIVLEFAELGETDINASLQFKESYNVAVLISEFLGTIHIVCNHEFSGTIIAKDYLVTEATCDIPGVYYYSCVHCGEIATETFTGDTKAHEWDEGVVTKEATYKKEGEKTYTCLACGATKTSSIAKKTIYIIEVLKDMIEIFLKYWQHLLIRGLGITLILSFITVVCGAVLGAILAIIKRSSIKLLSWLITVYVEIVRGTPMLLQLYIGYFLVPEIIPALNSDPFTCVAIALVLNSGAYVSEIIRSGIEAVDKGQTEAARSLGLGAGTTMTSVVLPQAIKNILPALGNEFITIIKETSLASTFFVGELMTIYTSIKSATFNPIPVLMIVGIIYFVVNFVLSKIMKLVERKMKYHD